MASCSTIKAARLALGLTLAAATSPALASPRDQAARIFNRLNGVPPSAEKLDELEALVASGDVKAAAMAAINDPGGRFYSLTVKTMAAKWSNVDKSPRVELNDFIATVIGIIRDDIPFTDALSANILYTSNVAGAPAYSLANNDHYTFAEASGTPLVSSLQKVVQSEVNGLPSEAIAGLLSTRGFGDAYIKAGTNRRAIAFSIENFLCHTMEQISDTTRSDFRVRRDVTRAPGGDAALFRNKCVGCHASMDAFGGAFAYYDWNDNTSALFYSPGVVRAKFNRNAIEFPDGFVTTDDSWLNNITEGQNQALGWHGETAGNGAGSFGKVLAHSNAFASCMAQHAFRAVCLRDPTTGDDKSLVANLSREFASDQFNMKRLFANTASGCLK